MTSKQDKSMVKRLERIFPKLEMRYPAELNEDKHDCYPEETIDWYAFLDGLATNGLEIVRKQK